MKKGIDISYWQGAVDFGKVSQCVDFAILRDGYRKKVDSKFFEYVNGCTKHGIPVLGVYHFSYALNSVQAREEAELAVRLVEEAGLGKDVVIFYDFEYDTVSNAKKAGVTLGKKECMLFTTSFCDYVESKGYKAGVYSNIDYYKNMYDKDLLSRYVFWLADYSGSPDYDCTFHQYSNKGRISGINGNVDLDYFYEEKYNRKEDVNMGVTAQDVLNAMRSWIGFSEANGKFKQIIDLYNSHKPLARGYAVKYTDEWCDTCVSAAAIKAGAVDLIGTECGCEQHVKIFQAKGIWIEDGTITPQPGDVILYNWDDKTQPNDGYSDHIGYVESVHNGQIVVIEGNKGEAVGRRTIPVGWGYIRGYARPKYSSGGASSPASFSTGKKSVNEVAKEVIAGKWGNGDARKAALTKAGYDYSAVQAKVNELLSGKKLKSVNEIAKEVIQGKWGNGSERKRRLTQAGYDYAAVQNAVNKML